MRLIDADALNKKIGMYYGITCDCADGVVDSIENEIDSAPTIGRWIPVMERLPEENGLYLTSKMANVFPMPYIAITNYLNGVWYSDTEITAWMPLPKPYEGSEKE